MPKFHIRAMKVLEFEGDFEADTEDGAWDKAMNVAPGLSAVDAGWMRQDGWSVEDGDGWVSVEDHYGNRWSEEDHGSSIELIAE